MLKAAVIGAGRMGRGHIAVYQQLMREGFPVKLVAVCDVDEEKFSGKNAYALNIGQSARVNTDTEDSGYACYTSLDEMLRQEELDVVDIVIPTYLHADAAVKCMRAGVHVLCEKPMSLTPAMCAEMIEVSRETGRRLMVGQCLHFWKEYVILADVIKSGRLGKCNDAYFYRGGAQNIHTNPSWQQWIIDRKLGGGGLFDQHIHDIDAIRWVFGTPKAVRTVGRTIHPRSAYDICTTQYFFDDEDLVVSAHDNTCYKGSYGFRYGYTVNFEAGTMVYENGTLTIMPEGEAPEVIERDDQSAYYREIVYFLNGVAEGCAFDRCTPEDAMENVRIALAEMESADKKGELVRL